MKKLFAALQKSAAAPYFYAVKFNKLIQPYSVKTEIFQKTTKTVFCFCRKLCIINYKIISCLRIYDGTPTLVAYGASLSVNVSEIFNNDESIQVFDSFSKEFSKSAEPINSAKFINGGKQIEITYLSGEDYSRITEVKDIDLNSGK